MTVRPGQWPRNITMEYHLYKQTSQKPPSSSSSLCPSTMTSTFTCAAWILQSTQVCVHVRTFARQTQSESLNDLGLLHARHSSTASGAGFPSIQSIGRLDSSSTELPIFHLNPTGSRTDGIHCRLRLQIDA